MATLKNTEISDTVEIPQGTTNQRPQNPQVGQIRFNTDINFIEYYNGDNWQPVNSDSPIATGGLIVDSIREGITFRTHVFTDIGTSSFVVSTKGKANVLVVGGGGGGSGEYSGSVAGGGGGGGGVLKSVIDLEPQTYSVTVGDGGAGGSGGTSVSEGGRGGDTTAFGITAFGGGGGATGTSGNPAPTYSTYAGGGGATAASATNFPAPATVQGNEGGEGGSGPAEPGFRGGTDGVRAGGGGGAGYENVGGRGGDGVDVSLEFGTWIGEQGVFSGGGAGGFGETESFIWADNIQGGRGGGGAGAGEQGGGTGYSGWLNTGGGGGAGDNDNDGSPGAAGIVVVCYEKNPLDDSAADLTVVDPLPKRHSKVRDKLVLDLDATNPISYPGSGNIWKDLTGNHEAVVSGAAFNSDFPGKFQFVEDSGDRIEISQSSDFDITGGNFTVEIWYKLDQKADYVNTYYDVFGIEPNGGAGTLYIRIWRSEVDDTTPGAPFTRFSGTQTLGYNASQRFRTTNRWNHLVLVEDNGNASFYQNGELRETVSTPSFSSSANVLRIGYSEGNTDRTFLGQISEFRWYRKPLDENEIRQNFNATSWKYGE